MGEGFYHLLADCVYHIGCLGAGVMKKKPADSTLDQAWRRAVLEAFHYRCAMCGLSWKQGALQCHHIIKRRKKLTRWDWRNGVPLCAECHQKAHTKQGEMWLMRRHPYYEQLATMEQLTFKDYLQAMEMSENEWRRRVLKELKEKAEAGVEV